MAALSETQISAFRRDGFVSPIPLLDDDERLACVDGLARFERWLGAPVNATPELKWRTMPHLTLPWVSSLAHDARILDCVEPLLGPDLLVYTSTFFIKDPGSATVAAWHQDSTYYGLSPPEEVTVWIALTDADRSAGCMEVLPFDGAPRQMLHAAKVVENSVNRASQRIVEPIDDTRAVAMPLEAGSFSMHHGLCPHRSGPNHSRHRRVGLGLNFVPTRARPIGSVRPAATLARGNDRFGHFELLRRPASELDRDAIAAHAHAVALYGAVYVEQEARHASLSPAS